MSSYYYPNMNMPMNLSKDIKSQFNNSGFFIIRFPKKSVSHLYNWQGDKTKLRATLKLWLAEPEVREALYIASPSLIERISYWIKDPDNKKGKKIEQTLTKYFIRMHSRCTPFGTFCGVTLGTIYSSNNLALEKLTYKRTSRLDMLIPFQLKKKIWRNKELFKQMELTVNSTIYQLNDKIRYIESDSNASEQLYQLSSISSNEYIECVLNICNVKAKVTHIIEAIHKIDEELTEPEIEQFLWDLVEAGVLEITMPMSITNSGSSAGVIEYCQNHGLKNEAAILSQCQHLLTDLDKKLGQDEAIYKNISQSLTDLPIEINQNRSIQTDLWYETSGIQISQDFVSQLLIDVSDLAKLTVFIDERLSDFKTKFIDKYESHAVPLLEVLDDESGIGFSVHPSINTPILNGVAINSSIVKPQYSWTELDGFILEKISQASTETEIVITKADVKGLSKTQHQQIPPSYYLSGSLIKEKCIKTDREEFTFELQGLGGPSAANTLGRFCHLDENLLSKTKSELLFEQGLFPSAILAEIVHFPEGKVGNVIARPQLRDFEIPFLADASVEKENQIALKDLQVFIQNDRVVLWSIKHNKEVIPRLSCAHNTRDNTLGIYNFLASLQNQNMALPFFSLPNPTHNLSYIPRIRLGKLILSPRLWRIPLMEVKSLINDFSFKKSNDFREKYNLPKQVVFKEYDQKLLIDLNNILSLSALLSSVKYKDNNPLYKVTVEEALQTENREALTHDLEPFFNEVIIPLRNPEYKHPRFHYPSMLSTPEYQTKFLNGDQWLSCKIYCGQLIAEEILVNSLTPWINKKLNSNKLANFFFLRFADPEFHIRLRLQVSHSSLVSDIQNELSVLLNNLFKEKQVSDVNWISYTRETERYGGKDAMLLSEQVFTTDSNATLALLTTELPDDLLWKVAIVGCDLLLKDFKLSLKSTLNVFENLRSAYGREFNEDINTRLSLGKKYRDEKESLYQLLEEDSDDDLRQKIANIFKVRSKALTPTIKNFYLLKNKKAITCPIERIIASFLHMHTNRLLKGDGRKQELCIYDFLLKYYKQQMYQVP